MSVERSRHRRLILWAVLFLACFYGLFAPGRIDGIDGQARFEVGWGLLNTGRPVPGRASFLRIVVVPGRSGDLVSYFGPAHTLLSLPLLLLVRGLWGLDHVAAEIAFSLINPLCAAACAGVYLHLLLRLGHRPQLALLSTMILGIAAPLWPSALGTTEAPQVALCLLLLLLSIHVRKEATGRSAGLLLGGAAMGWLGLLRENDAAAALPLLVALCLAREEPPRERLRAACTVALCGLPFLGLYLGYNLWRYGGLSSLVGRFTATHSYGLTPWTDPASGLYGLLLSSEKSVFLYAPTVLLAGLGWPALYRRAHLLSTAALCTVALTLLTLAPLASWRGDWAWGPRYLLGLVPLLHLALPDALRSPLARWLGPGVVAAGLLVQLAGVAIPYPRYFMRYGLDLAYIYDRWAPERRPEPQLRYHLRELPGILRSTRARLDARDAARIYTGHDVAMAPASPQALSKDGPKWIQRFAEFDSAPWFWVYHDLQSQGRLRWPLRFGAGALLLCALCALAAAWSRARRS